ncbi:MAG: hypothetical protein WC718_15240 [Phycisphaerales bacterium]|jgi:hypothetical protein
MALPVMDARRENWDVRLLLRPDQYANLRALAEATGARSVPSFVRHVVDAAILNGFRQTSMCLPEKPRACCADDWGYHYATCSPSEALKALQAIWGLRTATATIEHALLAALEGHRTATPPLANADKIKAGLMRHDPLLLPKPKCQFVAEADEGMHKGTYTSHWAATCKRNAKYQTPADNSLWCDKHYHFGDVPIDAPPIPVAVLCEAAAGTDPATGYDVACGNVALWRSTGDDPGNWCGVHKEEGDVAIG